MSRFIRLCSITLACVPLFVFAVATGSASAQSTNITEVGSNFANVLLNYRAPGQIFTERSEKGNPGAVIQCSTPLYGTLLKQRGMIHIVTTLKPEYIVSTTSLYVSSKGPIKRDIKRWNLTDIPAAAYNLIPPQVPVPVHILWKGERMTLSSFTAGAQVPYFPPIMQQSKGVAVRCTPGARGLIVLALTCTKLLHHLINHYSNSLFTLLRSLAFFLF